MKSFILAFLSFFCLPLFAQTDSMAPNPDTLYFASLQGFLTKCPKDKAEGYCLKAPPNFAPHTQQVYYLQSGITMAEYECYDYNYKNPNTHVESVFPVKNGVYEEWYIDGTKRISCNYAKDKLDGTFKAYYPSGKLKREEVWKKGEWQSGKCLDEEGHEIEYCAYQEMAEFVGGIPALIDYMGSTLKYPELARENSIEGTVYVHFIIEKDGSISNIEVVRSVASVLDAEAVRMVKAMPKWKPGKVEGELKRFEFNLPVKFKLE